MQIEWCEQYEQYFICYFFSDDKTVQCAKHQYAKQLNDS